MNKKQIKKKLKMMDVLVTLMFLMVVVFISVMVAVFIRMGAVPDTLIVSTFAFFGFEAGVMGYIKTTKDKLEKELEKHERKSNPADHSVSNDNADYGSSQKAVGRKKTQ